MKKAAIKNTLKTIFAGLLALAGAGPARANHEDRFLGRGEIAVYGLNLKSEPARQTVPKDIATIVSVYLQTPTLPGNLLPFAPDAEVRAVLRGPSFPEPLELKAKPNTPFNIPPLKVSGLHTLENIRLVTPPPQPSPTGGEGENRESDGMIVLLRAAPESVEIDVIEKLLVTQVTARPLSAAEIREKGIVFDKSNFQAFNFSAAFAIQDRKINIDFPVVLPTLKNVDGQETGPADIEIPGVDAPSMPTLQTLIPDTLKLQTQVPNLSVVGFVLEAPTLKDQNLVLPPIPGVVVIPGDIGFLNQFFSVNLMVGNVAPAGSNLVVTALSADIVLPAGNDQVVNTPDDPLAMARTAGGETSRRRPVIQPGPDEKLGTADDINALAPGETGNAEYLVEGRREGNHRIEMEISGTLTGLPVGPVAIRGRAVGSVLVRNPNFTLTFTHPDVVTAGEPYTLDVTVTNTGASPANFVSLNLFPRNVSGATVVGQSAREIETIAPGDAAAVSFDLISHRTGQVIAAQLDAAEQVAGRFQLKTSVGELGVPLSPDSLVLPAQAKALPKSLREAALGLLGKAWAVATAPAAALPQDVRRFSKKIVLDRAVEVAQAGFRVSLHEPLADSAAQLYMDFLGSDYARLSQLYPDVAEREFMRSDFEGFDALRRTSKRGREFAAAVGVEAQLSQSLATLGLGDAHQALARKWSYRPGHVALWVNSASTGPVSVEWVDNEGRILGGDGMARGIPFGDVLYIGGGALVTVAVPQASGYTLRLKGEGQASVVYPGTDGELHQHIYDIEATPTLALSHQGGGDTPSYAVLGGTPILSRVIVDPAPTLVGVVQQRDADVLTREDQPPVPVGRVVAALFSEEVTVESVRNALNYGVDENQVLDVSLQPGRRVAFIALRDPIGPFVGRSLSVSGVEDLRGQALTDVTLPIETTVPAQAGLVKGRIIQADGTPVPFADVRLFYWLDGGGLLSAPRWVGVTAKTADAEGRFSLDYVARALPPRLVVVDPQTEEFRDMRFSVQRNGQELALNVVFVGRGSFEGLARNEAGAPLPGTFVKVTSLFDQSQYAATTDEEGRFAVSRIPVGNIFVEAVNVEAKAKFNFSELIPFAGAVTFKDFTLLNVETATVTVRRGTVAGRVFRADGTTPAENAPAILYYRNGSQPGVNVNCGQAECAVGYMRTEAEGAFRFPDVPAGELRVYTFDAASLEEGNARVLLAQDSTATVNVFLAGGLGEVAGVVKDADGHPVAGAEVGGGYSLTTTTVDGSFLLKDVPVGTRQLVAVSRSLNTQGTALVTVGRAGETVNAVIVLEARGAVAGRVFTAAGAPAANQKVYLFRKALVSDLEGSKVNLQVFGQAVTNALGQYQISGVAPGEYEVSAFNTAFTDGNIAKAVLKFHGQVYKADIRYRGAGGRVAGRVLQADGRTPVKAKVGISGDQLLAVGGVGVMFQSVQNFAVADTDMASGAFSLGGLWTGPFTLRAATLFAPQPIAVQGQVSAPGETVPLDVVLPSTGPNGSLAGQVRGVVYLPNGVTPAGPHMKVIYRSAAMRAVCEEDLTGEESCRDEPQGIQEEIVVTGPDGEFWIPQATAGLFSITADEPEDSATRRTGQSLGVVAPGDTAETDVRLLGQGILTVNVFGADGVTPVTGARVKVKQLSYPGKEVEATGRTVFEGADAFSEGEFVVEAESPDGFTGRAAGRIERDAQAVTVNVYLYNAVGTAVGAVLRPDRLTPVPNAEVVVANAAGPLAFALTDAEGRYRVENVPLGDFSVEAWEAAGNRRGSARGRIDLNGQEVPVTVVQEALGFVKGTALEAGPLTPLKGWQIVLAQTSVSGRSLPTLRGTSGVDGAFAFPGVGQGSFVLSASKKTVRGEASAGGRITREGQSIDIPLLVAVERALAGAVRGTIYNPDGSAAADSQVEVCYAGRCANNVPPVSVTADGDGEYAVPNVPLGRFTVSAKAQGSANRGGTLGEVALDGEVVTADVVMTGLSRVEGVVEDQDGNPVSGMEVRLTGTPAVGCEGGVCVAFSSPTTGRFHFDEVPSRTFNLVAQDPINPLKGAAGGLLNPGETRAVRLVLEPTAALTGRALLADGLPAAGITVELALTKADGQQRTFYRVTPAEGFFSFDAVPLGSYVLTLEDPLGEGIFRRSGALLTDLPLGDLLLDESPPAVMETMPAAASVDVPLTGALRVRFTEPVNPATVNAAYVTLSSGLGTAAATLTLSDNDRLLTLTPAAPLRDGTVYTLRVRNVEDRVGKPMVNAFVLSFTTRDATPPAVLDLSPAPQALGVALDSVVRIKYSEPVEPAGDIALSLNGTPVEGRADYILGNTTLVFTPNVPLLEDVSYRVQAGPARDLSGNVQAAGLDFTFATTDRLPPVVTSLAALTGDSVKEGSTATYRATVPEADVSFVDFSVNGVFMFTDRTVPFEMSFLAAPPLGRAGDLVQVSAQATDVSGNRGPATNAALLTITPDLAPTAAITAPIVDAAVPSGQGVAVQVSAADDLGLARVGYRADTGRPEDAASRRPTSTLSTTETFVWQIPADALPGTMITLTAFAEDTRGQVTPAAPVTVRVQDATPPAVIITSVSAAGSLLPGQDVRVEVTATDLGGIAEVNFYTAGVSVTAATQTVSPAENSVTAVFHFYVPNNAAPGQAVVLNARALDAAGNVGIAPALLRAVADAGLPTVRVNTPTGNLAVAAGETARLVVDAEDAIAVKTVELSGDAADARQISPPRGGARVEFTVGIPAGLPEGATRQYQVRAQDTSDNWSFPASITLTVAPPVEVALPESIIVTAGKTQDVAVTLTHPAPAGGLTMTLASDNGAIATVTPLLTFAAGDTAKMAQITGVSGGVAQIAASVANIQRASLSAAVQGGVVSGTVYDRQFNPVAGASVTVTGGGAASALSDEQGRFMVTGLNGPAVTVKAQAPGLRGTAAGGMNRTNGFVSLNVIVDPAGAVKGTVFLADGATAAGAGAQVTLSAVPALLAFTDELGRYEFPAVPAGTYTLDAQDTDGRHGRAQAIVSGTGEEVTADITYLGRGRVAGVVLGGGGEPVANAVLSFRSTHLFGVDARSGSAGLDGTFLFDDVFIGAFTLDAQDPVTGLSARTTGAVIREGEALAREIRLAPYGHLAGTVFRADGTTRVSGAQVSARGKTAVTDAQGRYALDVLPLGNYQMSVSVPGTRGMGVAGGALTDHRAVKTQDVTLFPQGSITVAVLNASTQPVAGALVRVNSANGQVSDQLTALTDGEGAAALNNVLAGNFTLSAQSGGLSVSTAGALAGDGALAFTLQLPAAPPDNPPPPTGAIAGTVFAPGGAVPVTAGHVRINGTQVPLNADGTFFRAGLPLGTYHLSAHDAAGRLRAYGGPVTLAQKDDLVAVPMTFTGLGTVRGQVMLPGGIQPAPGMPVSLQSLNPVLGGARGATTNAAGFYEVTGVPVGAYTIVVSVPAQQLLGSGQGSLENDGGESTTHILLAGNVVALPVTRRDGNNFAYDLRGNGTHAGAAWRLSITHGAEVADFTGAAVGSGEEGNREIAVTQANLLGLEVTRKTFVPRDGYFARVLEVLRNTGDAAVTVDVRLVNGLSSDMSVITSTPGAAVLDDNDDRDPFLASNLPAVAFVHDGPGAADAADEAVLSGGAYGFVWRDVTIAAGSAAAFLHMTSQETSRAGARAAMERLAQLPPETLTGLSAEELGLIRNFAAPLDGRSLAAPLPPLTAAVTGRVYQGDAVSVVGGAAVRFKSDHPLFGRTWTVGTDGNGDYALSSLLDDNGGTRLIPAHAFTVEAVHPFTGVKTPVAAGNFAPGETTAAQDIVFDNTGLLAGRVRRHTGEVATAGQVNVSSPTFSKTVSLAGDGSFLLTGLVPGDYTLTASVPHGQGTGLNGSTVTTVAAALRTETDVTLEPTGALRGAVRRGGTPVSAVDVQLFRAGFSRFARTDTGGQFFFPDLPEGNIASAFTLRAVDPVSHLPAAAAVAVTRDQTTLQDLSLIGLGAVQVAVVHPRGIPAAAAPVRFYESAKGGPFQSAGNTNAQGRVSLTNVTAGTVTLRALHPVNNAYFTEQDVFIAADGQNISATLVLPAVGSVGGRVARANGEPVGGVTVTVISPDPLFGTKNFLTDAEGIYRVPALAPRAFTARVLDLGRGFFGETAGVLSGDGIDAAGDILVQENVVSLPLNRFDANNFLYDIQGNGALSRGSRDAFLPPAGAAVLELAINGQTIAAPASAIAQSIQDRQGVSSFETPVGNLLLKRLATVPQNGYFARYLEVLQNPTAEPVTVTLRVRHHLRRRIPAAAPVLYRTSSGDASLDATDTWAVLDDDQDQDPFLTDNIPAVAAVFNGASAQLLAGPDRVTLEWQNLTLAPGATVATLHFLAQQVSRAGGAAAAERLAQLPSEALAGLSTEERAQIHNFTVPPVDPAGPAPLPSLLGGVEALILEGDVITPVPAASVAFKSLHPLFGRTWSVTADALGDVIFTSTLTMTGNSRPVPVAPFTLSATHPFSNAVSPVVGGEFIGGETAFSTVTFSNTGVLTAVLKRADWNTVAAHAVTLTGNSLTKTITTNAAGQARFPGLTGGTYLLRAVEPFTGLASELSVTVAAGTDTARDLIFIAVGSVRGQAAYGNGQPVAGASLQIFESVRGSTRTVGTTDAAGQFLITNVPAGALTVTITHPNDGTVRAQAAGVLFAENQEVAVSLSLPSPVMVPDLTGMTQAAAQVLLSNAGLTAGTVSQQYHPAIPEGLILSQSPSSGTVVLEGRPVQFVLSSGPAPICVPMPNRLVSFWTGDASGADIVSSNNGGLENGASLSQGLVGQSFTFGADTEHVLVPHHESLNIPEGGDFTWEGWINISQIAVIQSIVEKSNAGGSQTEDMMFFVTGGTGQLRLYLKDSSGTSDFSSVHGVPINQWTHVAVSRQGNTGKIYLNGIVDGTATMSTGRMQNTVPLVIGAFYDTRNSNPPIQRGRGFSGRIDELSFYKRALSDGEISAIHQNSAGGKCRELPENQPPVVDAGADQTSSIPNAVHLSGSATDDAWPVGSTVTYAWSQLSGPAPLTFMDRNKLSTYAVHTATGTYEIELSASDGDAVGVDRMTLTISDECPLISTTPAAWWPGDGHADDLSGPRKGSLVNGVAYAPGKVGQAFIFDGQNDYVELPSMNLGTSYSVEFWMNPERDIPGYQHLVSNDDRSGSFGAIYQQGRLIRYYQAGQTQVTTSTTVPLNQWSHVALVQEGTESRLYLNGVLSGTGTATAPFNNALRLGWAVNPSDFLFQGRLDEVRVYDGALSGADIAAIHESGTKGFCKTPDCRPLTQGIVARWQGEGDAQDSAGLHHGQLLNGASIGEGRGGSGFSFDGVNDYAWIPSHAVLNRPDAFGLSFWFRPEETISPADPKAHVLFAKGSGFTVGTANGDGRLEVVRGASPRPTSQKNTWPAGDWQHVAVSFDASGYSLYINGMRESTVSNTVSLLGNNAAITLGSDAGNPANAFKGSMDEVELYGRSLSDTEVQEIYNAGLTGRCRSLPPNQAPRVDAGPDATAAAGSLLLSGNVTDDGIPVNASITSTWSKISGPGNVVFSDSHALSTTATFDAPGEYVLRLSGTDGVLTASDDVTITVLAMTRTGAIAHEKEEDLYAFTAQVGDELEIIVSGTQTGEFSPLPDYAIRTRVFSPGGVLIGENAFTTPRTGTHVINVRSLYGMTGGYQVILQRNGEDVPIDIFRGGAVTGRLMMGDNATPATNQRVFLKTTGLPFQAGAFTDGEGNFIFTGVPTGPGADFTVFALLESGVEYPGPTGGLTAPGETASVAFSLPPQGVLSGRALYARGTPPHELWVSVEVGGEYHSTTNAENGYFSFADIRADVPFTLRAYVPGGPSREVVGQIPGHGQTLDLEVTLPAEANLLIQVRDPLGNPLPGLNLYHLDQYWSWRGQTDGEGNFNLQGLPEGTVQFLLRDGEWTVLAERSTIIHSSDDGNTIAYPVVLDVPAGAVRGTVRMGPGGPPLPYMEVLVLNVLNGDQIQSVSTDENGNFAFPSIRAGENGFTLQARYGGFEHNSGVLRHSFEGETIIHDIDLPLMRGSVQGRVFAGDGQTALPSAELSFFISEGDPSHTYRTHADEEGRFTFNDVLASAAGFKIAPMFWSHYTENETPPLAGAFSSPGEVLTLDIIMPISIIKGRLLNAEGEPVLNPRVYVEGTDYGMYTREYYGTLYPPRRSHFEQEWDWEFSDPTGEFIVFGTPPGPFRIVGYAQNAELRVSSDSIMGDVSQPMVMDLRLPASVVDPGAPTPGTGAISGVLLGEDGETPIPGVWVTLYSFNTGSLSRQTNARGEFQFSDVSHGEILLESVIYGVGVPRAARHSFTFNTGEESVSLRLGSAVENPTHREGLNFFLLGDIDLPFGNSNSGHLGDTFGFTQEDGEMIVGPASLSYTPTAVKRRVFTPENGNFTRTLDELENLSDSPQSVHIIYQPWIFEHYFSVLSTSALTNQWIVEQEEGELPLIGAVISGAHHAPNLTQQAVVLDEWQSRHMWRLDLEPHQKAFLMQFVIRRATGEVEAVRAQAEALLTLTDPDALMGITEEERARIVNFYETPPNTAPEVDAGEDQQIFLPGHAFLSGRILDDGRPEGITLSSRWEQIDGPVIAHFTNAHAAVTTAQFVQPGDYVLRLTADDSQYVSSDTVRITVYPLLQNVPPVIDAGPNQVITLPATAVMAGSASDDGLPSGAPLTLTWEKHLGPGDVVFTPPDIATPTVSFSIPGAYLLKLTAGDSLLSSSDTVSVDVLPAAPINNPPQVNAGPDKAIALTNPLYLTGSVTDDGSGGTLSSAWSVVSGTGTVVFENANATSTWTAFHTTGTYVLHLEASDGVLNAFDEMIVTVSTTCSAPPSGLVAWWDGDGTAADRVGNNYGIPMNGVSYVPGLVGQAFRFDGTDDYVRVDNEEPFDFGAGSFSLSMWVKTSAGRSFNEHILSKGNLWGGNDDFVLWVGGVNGTGDPGRVQFQFRFYGSQDLISTTRIDDDDWHLVTVTQSGACAGCAKLYIDGVLEDTKDGQALENGSDPLIIGGAFSGGLPYSFKGLLDEVDFYRRALPLEEIQTIHAKGTLGRCKDCAPAPAGLVSWWPGDGNTDDLIGGNPGALQNGASFTVGRSGGGFKLDGVDDFVEFPDRPELTPESLTIEAWVKAEELSGSRVILSKYNSNNPAQGVSWYLGSEQGRVSFIVYGGLNGPPYRGFETTGQALQLGHWHHVAGTFDIATQIMKIIVDGRELPASLISGSASSIPSIADSATPVRMGVYIPGSGVLSGQWKGDIDEPALYNRSLSETEVQPLYRAGAAGKCAESGCLEYPGGLIAAWRGDLVAISTFDAVTDFSLASNPAGAWSYGETAFLGASFVPYPTAKPNLLTGLDAWGVAGADPNVIKNKTSGTLSYYNIDFLPDMLHVHPGPSAQKSVVRWTAPAAGMYRVDFRFMGLQRSGTTTDVWLLRNGAASAPLFSGNISGFGVSTALVRTTDVWVSAGDTLDFVVGEGGNGYVNDSTGLSATISRLALRDERGVHTGELNGAGVIAVGRAGPGLFFDGADGFVSVGTGVSAALTDDFTVEAWIKGGSDEQLKFLFGTREASSEEKGVELYVNPASVGGTIVIQADAGAVAGYRTGRTNVRDGEWHHVAGVRSGSTYHVYVDGVLDDGENHQDNTGTIESSAPALIGRTPSANDNPNRRWSGLMDEVAVYDRALSGTDIRALHRAGVTDRCRTILNP